MALEIDQIAPKFSYFRLQIKDCVFIGDVSTRLAKKRIAVLVALGQCLLLMSVSSRS